MKEREIFSPPVIYLAGPWDQYSGYWKKGLKDVIKDCQFYDPETDSAQESPESYFPQDIKAIKEATHFIGFPGKNAAEAMWTEAGYFYATHTKEPGEYCNRMVIYWPEDRKPDWALPFLKEMCIVTGSMDETKAILQELVKRGR